MTILDYIPKLEARLTAKRFHAMPGWWLAELTRFYRSGRTQSVWRVGRRGGKSSSLCRVAVLETYYGEHELPAGDEGVFAIISADRDQARARIRTCAEILRVLGIPFEQTADELRFRSFREHPVMIKVLTASVAGVVGITCIGVVLDEVARWVSHDRGGSPAAAILESVRPTMATQPNAKLFMLSSPMGEEDLHAQAYAQGESSYQTIHFAPTWTANPSLTEARCRQIASSEREFLREYAAIPQGAFEVGFYDWDTLAASSDKERGPEQALPGPHPYVIACDPGFVHDCFAIAVAHAEETGVVLDWYCELRGEGGYLSPDYALSYVAGLRKLWPGGFAVLGDQASAAVLVEAFAAKGVMYIVQPWSPTTLMEKHSTVRTLLADRRLKLPRFGALQKQLAKLGVKITASGQETIASVDGHIGDAASACVAAIAEAHTMLPMRAEQMRGAFNTVGQRRDGLSTAGAVDGSMPSEDTRCVVCGEIRGACAHTN